jgi:hypothetical protein
MRHIMLSHIKERERELLFNLVSHKTNNIYFITRPKIIVVLI